jgi:Holliday junction resolvase RusA-like endonuclease
MGWVRGEVIRITVPGVPRALERNRHRIVTTRDKRQFVANYLPSQSAKEQSTIRWYASQAMNGRSAIECPLELRFAAYLPIPASWSKKKQTAALADELRPGNKPDLSNLVKNCEDAMNMICYRDDSLITDCALFKRYSSSPRIVIELRPLTWV